MPADRQTWLRRAAALAAVALLVLRAPLVQAADAGTDAGPSRSAEEARPAAEALHAHGHAEGMLQAPEDRTEEDPRLPAGTLEVHVADASGRPLAEMPVTVGILFNSVAKGESRKRVTVTTNASGVARLDQLDTGSSVAYRPTVVSSGATFAVMPFRLPEKAGMRALLHVYPVVESLDDALIVTQSILYAEVKDDRIQIQQAFRIYNFGRVAWVPKELVVALPPEFTAFTSQEGMSDVGVDAVPKQGVRVHGTFGPGQHVLDFRWQLPYSKQAEVRFDVGMPPHLAASRVITPAAPGMTLEVAGFPPPQSTNDGMGQRALITEKQMRREEPALTTISIAIRGLPSEGAGKIVATFLAGSVLLLGVVLGSRRPGQTKSEGGRDRLLAELEGLERAHRAGDVGPKTYDKERRDLLDALARIFAEEARARPARRLRRT